jgi:hypothetical protein
LHSTDTIYHAFWTALWHMGTLNPRQHKRSYAFIALGNKGRVWWSRSLGLDKGLEIEML